MKEGIIMLDVIIRNAKVIDGSGQNAYIGDVGIENGKIVLNCDVMKATEEVDATGKILCPGFIDSHSHMDALLGKMDTTAFTCKISQGVTTEMTGQCGESVFPLRDIDEYFEWVDKHPKVGNYAFLCGHSAVRQKVMEMRSEVPTKAELTQMKDYVNKSMEHGCYGMSSGLIYIPGVYAKENELIELCKVVHDYDGTYATHMRSESDHIIKAVKEAIDIAETARVKLVISHHKIVGKPNWGKSKDTLGLVHAAIDRGLTVTIDQYPYNASQTVLNTSIPPEYFVNGYDNLIKLLKEPKIRAEMKTKMTAEPTTYNCGYRNVGGFNGILVVSAPNTRAAEGKTVEEYAKEIDKDPFDAYFDLLIDNDGIGGACYFGINTEEIDSIYLDPNTVVGSDSVIYSEDGPVHPRAYGTFSRSIKYFCKDKRIISLEEAIRKQTSMTAKRWGIKNKGLIKEGYDADLLIFDYDELEDMATFKEPRRISKGIEKVYVNGVLTYADYKFTGAKPGKCVYKSK